MKYVLIHIGSTQGRDSSILKSCLGNKFIYYEINGVSHKKAIEFMFVADILVCFVTPQKNNTTPPGKLYEYIATGKPILYIIPADGKIDEGVELVVHGEVCANIKEEISDSLDRLYKLIKLPEHKFRTIKKGWLWKTEKT